MFGGGERDVAIGAVAGWGEELAEMSLAGLASSGDGGGDAVGEALDLAVAERGDGDGRFGAVDG